MARAAWSDTEMLFALDLRDHEGLTAAQIGHVLGRSARSVLGCLQRIDRDTNATDVTP